MNKTELQRTLLALAFATDPVEAERKAVRDAEEQARKSRERCDTLQTELNQVRLKAENQLKMLKLKYERDLNLDANDLEYLVARASVFEIPGNLEIRREEGNLWSIYDKNEKEKDVVWNEILEDWDSIYEAQGFQCGWYKSEDEREIERFSRETQYTLKLAVEIAKRISKERVK